MKVAIVIFCIAIFYREISTGYFHDYKSRLASLNKLPYAVTLICSLIVAICLVPFDQQMLHALHTSNAELLRNITAIGAMLGTDTKFWTILLVLYAAGTALGSKKLTKVIFGAILATVVSVVIVTILKLIVLRARPVVGIGAAEFFQFAEIFKGNRAFQSMPSGQVVLVSSAVAFIYYQLQNHWFRFFLAVLPVFSAVSRVSLNRHWPSDTIVSFGIAVVVAHVIFSCQTSTETPRSA